MNHLAPRCTLSPRQQSCALALAQGKSQEEASRESGAKVRTIKSWTALPHFRDHVHQLRSSMTSEALGKLIATMTTAADTLANLCRTAESQMLRYLAAGKILDSAVKLRECTELVERVAALEQAQKKIKRRIA